MSYQISLFPENYLFTAEAGQTVLEAALAAGLIMPHGCRNGFCGACKGRVVHGEIDYGNTQESVLPVSEREAGYALFCCARPRSDLELAMENVHKEGGFSVKQLTGEVHSLSHVAADVMVLQIKLSERESFQFKAGQYIDVILQDGKRRSFSIANAPDESEYLTLHIRLVEGGAFTPYVFNGMKAGDTLNFEGPLGSFWMNDSDHPIIMVAGGTGFAPIKAMIETLIKAKKQRLVTLYWGARDQSGLYMDELARHWEAQLAGFRYISVISGAASDGWQGRRGFVHEAVLSDFADLSGYEVYACGAPAMIDATRTALTSLRGLPEKAFFADAFTFNLT